MKKLIRLVVNLTATCRGRKLIVQGYGVWLIVGLVGRQSSQCFRWALSGGGRRDGGFGLGLVQSSKIEPLQARIHGGEEGAGENTGLTLLETAERTETVGCGRYLLSFTQTSTIFGLHIAICL